MDVSFDSIKGLTILSAIPVVLIALWADYFERYLSALTPEQMAEEREDNQNQNRLVLFCGLVAQASAALIGYSYWKLPGWVSYLAFLGAAAIQASAHLNLDRKLKGPGIPGNTRNFGLRSLIWVFVDITVYWMVVLAFVGLAAWVSPALSKDPGFTEFSMFLGGILGMFVGVGVNYALAPVFFKQMFPCRPLDDPYALQLFSECFERAGVRAPHFYLIDMDHFGLNNAMIAGFKSGRGPFRPALFVTRGLLKDLTRNELEAVVLHEVSHLALNHILKRFIYGFLTLIGATAIALLVVGALALVLPQSAAILLGVLVMLTPFVAPFLLIRRLSKSQEFEADAFAVTKLGAKGYALISVLRRLEEQQEASLRRMKSRSGVGAPANAHPVSEGAPASKEEKVNEKRAKSDSHPATEDRISAISRLLGADPELGGGVHPNVRPRQVEVTSDQQSDDRAA